MNSIDYHNLHKTIPVSLSVDFLESEEKESKCEEFPKGIVTLLQGIKLALLQNSSPPLIIQQLLSK